MAGPHRSSESSLIRLIASLTLWFEPADACHCRTYPSQDARARSTGGSPQRWAMTNTIAELLKDNPPGPFDYLAARGENSALPNGQRATRTLALPRRAEVPNVFPEPILNRREVLRDESLERCHFGIAAELSLPLVVIRLGQHLQCVVSIATGFECGLPSGLILFGVMCRQLLCGPPMKAAAIMRSVR
jgi:hypothetical protein